MCWRCDPQLKAVKELMESSESKTYWKVVRSLGAWPGGAYCDLSPFFSLSFLVAKRWRDSPNHVILPYCRHRPIWGWSNHLTEVSETVRQNKLPLKLNFLWYFVTVTENWLTQVYNSLSIYTLCAKTCGQMVPALVEVSTLTTTSSIFISSPKGAELKSCVSLDFSNSLKLWGIRRHSKEKLQLTEAFSLLEWSDDFIWKGIIPHSLKFPTFCGCFADWLLLLGEEIKGSAKGNQLLFLHVSQDPINTDIYVWKISTYVYSQRYNQVHSYFAPQFKFRVTWIWIQW
jgi:hypothetical protein